MKVFFFDESGFRIFMKLFLMKVDFDETGFLDESGFDELVFYHCQMCCRTGGEVGQLVASFHGVEPNGLIQKIQELLHQTRRQIKKKKKTFQTENKHFSNTLNQFWNVKFARGDMLRDCLSNRAY